MDLIYTNKAREDLGVLQDYDMDLAFGADENNFECTVSAVSHCCEEGSLLYMEGTEYGGIVDSIESDTASKEVKYKGRTWHGILDSKVIEPENGAAYLSLSGEANNVIAYLLDRLALTDLFEASSEDSGIAISNYKMNRYISGYDGIIKMLSSVGAKLSVTVQEDKVVLSVCAKHDYSTEEDFDSALVDFKATKKFNSVNHMICLGSGDLENRMVIHLYADKDGNISREQTQTGLDEYVGVFDYPNAESEDELIKNGTERLKKLWEPVTLTIDFDDTTDSYDVGDIVGAYDSITGISASAVITKKIVTIKNGQINISYKVGD